MSVRSTGTAMQLNAEARIGVVDPARQEIGGHHLTSLELLQEALQPHDLIFYVNKDSSQDIGRVLGDVRLAFTTDPDRPTPQRRKRSSNALRWRLSQSLRRIQGHPPDILDGQCYRNELQEILAGHDSMDHLIFPTTKIDTLASLITVIGQLGPDNIPHLHLRFLEYAPRPDRELARSSYAQLSELAASCPRIHIYTETETLRRYLQSRFGFTNIGKTILQPPEADPELRQKYIAEPGVISIGYVGGGLRTDKGFQRLPSIIGMAVQMLREADIAQSTRFVIQVSDDRRGRTLKADLSAIADLDPQQLSFVSGEFDLDEFSALLSSCDILLFPYSDEKKAQMISSGILIDAVINGVPVICTPIDTLTEFVTKKTGAVAESDKDFANAIVRLCANIEDYKANAAKLSDNFHDVWRKNVMIDRILGETSTQASA